MSKRTQTKPVTNQAPNAKNPQPPIINQEPPTINQLPITELDLPEDTIDHLVEQGIKTLGNLIEFSRDPEAMEAVLEPDSRQQVLALVATYEEEPDQDDDSDEGDPTVQQNSPPITSPAAALATSPAAAGTVKQARKQSPKATSETPAETSSEDPSNLQSQDSSLTDDLIQKTDDQLRREFLADIKQRAASETDERLARMLTKAKMDNDYEIIKIVNAEIDKRFESTRQKQMSCSIEIQYSDLQRRGYSASQESVSRFIHRQRITHEQGVALARIHLAMKEGGVKLRNGKRVTSKSQVIQKLLELAYGEMAKKN